MPWVLFPAVLAPLGQVMGPLGLMQDPGKASVASVEASPAVRWHLLASIRWPLAGGKMPELGALGSVSRL